MTTAKIAKDTYSTSGSSPPKDWIDKLWGERGITAKGWTSVPNLLTRHLGELEMTPVEFALVMALMSHKGKQDPWLSNATLAKYLGMTERGVQRLTARCEGRWLRKVTRRSDDGRQRTNQFDLTPLFEKLAVFSSGLVLDVKPSWAAPTGEANQDRDHEAVVVPPKVGEVAEEHVDIPSLSVEAIDGEGITLKTRIIAQYKAVAAELKSRIADDVRDAHAGAFADRLTKEQFNAVAASFGRDRVRGALNREEGYTFSGFAEHLVDSFGRGWIVVETKRLNELAKAERFAVAST